MSKSFMNIQFFIQKGEKPTISITENKYAKKENSDGDTVFDCRNAEIGIDLPKFHLELSLPENILRELVEKAQEFLGEKKMDMRDIAEDEIFPAG